MRQIMIISISFLLLFLCVNAAAQSDITAAAMVLQGVGSAEELEEDIVEFYEQLSRSRIRLNIVSENRLRSCGLFSAYQVASIADYRRRNGDILSVMELSLLDGFGFEYATALSNFVSFESGNAPGAPLRDSLRWTGEGSLRWKLPVGKDDAASKALRLRVGAEDRFELAAAARMQGSGASLELGSISAVVYGKGHLSRLVLGDVSARFGQGLVMWSGFSLSGFSSAASFAKHPSGINRAWTLSPSSVCRGAAASLVFGRMETSVMCGIDGSGLLNVTRWGHDGQAGITVHSGGLASADMRMSVGKLDAFSELALDFAGGSLAGLAGLTFNPGYRKRISALLRCYPSGYGASFSSPARSSSKVNDETGVAVAVDWENLVFSLDYASHPEAENSQTKALLKWSGDTGKPLVFSLRSQLRFRPEDTHRLRLEQRCTLDWITDAGFSSGISMDICHCSQTAFLVFAETVWKSSPQRPRYMLALRASLFAVDSWEDRIYSYERDVPGMFSVPAYYGRGWKACAVAGLRFGNCSLHMRASLLEYPFMETEKPGKAELRFNLGYSF